jgi:hypothetical protein
MVGAAAAALSLPVPTSGQEQPPAGLAAVEAARSRDCVGVLGRLAEVDASLAPLAARSQRLIGVAQAVALEERSVVDSLDASDEVESEVLAWFLADRELAERYLAERDEALVEERAAAREAIKARISAALEAVQAQANEVISSSGDLMSRASGCDGAVFIRGPVLEACETTSSPVCEAARGSEPDDRFRFVDRPEDLWDHQELRTWTSPGPLQAAPDGQLGGARTVAMTRTGNLLVSVAFAPLLQDRSGLTPEVADRLSVIDDSLGIESSHPDIAVAPSIGLHANLPSPLADESGYVLHFGTPDSADVVWSGPSGTGQIIQASVPLAAAHVARLVGGQPINFTAVRESEAGAPEAVFSVQLTSVNQAAATGALLAYMTDGLSADLARLVQPRSR